MSQSTSSMHSQKAWLDSPPPTHSAPSRQSSSPVQASKTKATGPQPEKPDGQLLSMRQSGAQYWSLTVSSSTRQVAPSSQGVLPSQGSQRLPASSCASQSPPVVQISP